MPHSIYLDICVPIDNALGEQEVLIVSKCLQILAKELMDLRSRTWLWSATLHLQSCTLTLRC